MSDAGDDKYRTETTVTPVRRPEALGEIVDRETPSWRWGKPLVAAASVLMILAALVVFVYLPNRVEQEQARNAAAAPVAPPVAEPVQPQLTREQRAALRAQAEDMLAQLLEQRQELEDRSVASWGAATWEAYETAARLGDDALLAEELTEAVAQYESALATGEVLFERSQEIMTNALAAGEAAIEAGNPELARNQFELVLTVDPDNQRALLGQGRAERLPAVLDAMRRGDSLAQAGDLESAADAYREALAVDANWAPARSALGAVTGRIAESRFESLITEGFSALDAKSFDRAAGAFEAALAMRPSSDVARDGLAQAKQGELLNSILMAEVRGQAFERRELWKEAMARYQEALDTDPTLTFAIEGLERARGRADLEAKLSALIDEPNRLLNDEVLEDAKRVLEEARAIEDPGPSHQSQTERLANLIDLASAPVSVTLVSDNATEVTVYRVGELGTFSARELELKPGRYTAVGSRRGFRDVRETFTVLPGRENGPVTVVCVESIQ